MCPSQQQELRIGELPRDSYSEPACPYALSENCKTHDTSRRLNPPTDEVYLAFARAKQFEPASTPLPLGAKAHWIGNESADKILVFFHGKHMVGGQGFDAKQIGGGYVKPVTTQLGLLWDIKTSLASKFAICLLSYSLAPEAQFPVQLQQAVHLLRNLVVDKGKTPENVRIYKEIGRLSVLKADQHHQIILCGDSAGGNLVLGLLSHLLHPHPSITPLKLPSPLLGAALISPWGDFSTSALSYTRNGFKDSIDASVLQKWSAYFMDGADTDNYNQPFRAPDSWWIDLNGAVRDVLITAGTDEVLVDDIKAFATKIEVRTRLYSAFILARKELIDSVRKSFRARLP